MFPGASSAREAHLTILFTNDHLGQVDPLHTDDPSKPVGGVTRRAALIKRIAQEVGPKNILLVDSGGMFTGTAFSAMTEGQVDCAAYQLMQYDAVGLGPHDFDYGKKTLLDYRKTFRIPWVSANAVVRNNFQNFMRPYVLKYAGVRVGMIGFSNPDTPSLTRRDNVSGLIFNPPGASAKGLHSILKKDADLFIALSQSGLEADKKFAKDNPFLHVIIGGYSRTLMTKAVVETKADGSLAGPLIVQAGSQGLYLGRLDLTLEGHRDPKTKKEAYFIQDYKYQLIPITSDLPEDPPMVDLLAKYKEKLRSKPLDEVLAAVNGDFTGNSEGDSLIGEISADALRKAAQSEIALLNNGFFRSSFKSGDLTREILYQVCPSDSEITVIDVPGIDLRKALEGSATQKGQDGFLQISGLKVQKTGDQLEILVGEEPLNDRRKYRVAVDDFLA
ncbi:MAG TPA: bifunctional UDP-sugar hydrolase/5'-nucleotidase, partial [bacterium]|nr:bifunctional UDP-sugar hydrolase/5'-nucleotidase [bacterium]